MGDPFGGNVINTFPCTESEEQRNWSIVENRLSQAELAINVINEGGAGGAVDTFKVKTTDPDGIPDFLLAKQFSQGTYNPENHTLASADSVEVGGSILLRLFIPKSADVDTFQVLIDENDTEPGFLLEKLLVILAALGSLEVEIVAITQAIAASAFDKAANKLSPVMATAPVFRPNGDGTFGINISTTITFKSYLKVAVAAPGAGKFKRGIVLGGVLIQVQCEEEDLPTGWGS